LIKIILKRF